MNHAHSQPHTPPHKRTRTPGTTRLVRMERRAPSGWDVDHGDEELRRSVVVRADDLIREALIALQRLRVFAVHDLHASPAVRKEWGSFGVSVSTARTRV